MCVQVVQAPIPPVVFLILGNFRFGVDHAFVDWRPEVAPVVFLFIAF